jgi:hypothetical protein
MQHFISLLSLSALALAAPRLEARQGINSNDLQDGCKDTVFIMARGSTELGNMVCKTWPATYHNISPHQPHLLL